MKKLLYGVLVVLLLLVGAVFALPPLLGDSLIKSRVVAAVEEATGRQVEIGELNLSLLPALTVGLRDLRLANAQGSPTPDMLRLARLDLEVPLLPLLGRELRVERLVVGDLEVALEVNEAGQPNWVFPGARGGMDSRGAGPGDGGAGGGLSGLRLGEVRLENAQVTFHDLSSGQAIEANEINLTAELADIAAKLGLSGGLVLNGKPITIAVGVDSPEALMQGTPATLAAAVTSELVALTSDFELAQKPQAAVDGAAILEIPSMAALLAWLEAPLPAEQPDPGALRVAAKFETQGTKVLLREAVVEGEALDLTAEGSFEAIDGRNAVVLTVTSGVLDIDRYLPPAAQPPVSEDAQGDAVPAKMTQAEMARGDGARRRSPMEGIPDEPFDLSGLKQTDADIQVSLAGIKAAGYEVGGLAVKLGIAGGKLQLDLTELALYGGGLTGSLSLDGSGEALGLAADFGLDKVDLGALTAVGAEAGAAPVAGIASGRLTAKASGATPRALVQGLSGGLAFKLGAVDVGEGAAGSISDVDLSVELPGLAASPRLTGQLLYNQRQVALDVTLDPLEKVMTEPSFGLQARIESELLQVTYAGAVQQRPLPGLDGRLDVTMPSVGQLAAWLGQPLPEGQPDPGPLAIEAVLAADGETVALTSASLTGKAAEATASGSFDGSGAIPRFEAKLAVAKLDLNAYLPAESKSQSEGEAAEAETAAAAAGGDGEAGAGGWSEEPIGLFAELNKAEGTVEISLANVLYRKLAVGRAAATLALAGGVLKADVSEVTFDPGQVTASAVVDGSGDSGAISYQVTLKGVESKPFLETFADVDFLSGKLNFETKGSASGISQKAIVGSLNGDGAFSFIDGAVEGYDLAGTLRDVGTLGVAEDGAKPKTDFTELSGSFTLTDGVLDNPDLKMLAPLVRVTGAGQVPLPPKTLDYKVEAKLVASLEGQGGGDAMSGLPIPVHAQGPWDALAYDIDYGSMFSAIAGDPARLANMPGDLADKASQFGVKLDIPGLAGGEGVGKLIEGVTGGDSKEGGSGDVLKSLLGGGKAAPQAAPAPSAAGPAPSAVPSAAPSTSTTGPAPSAAPSQDTGEEKAKPDLKKTLKGLFD